YLYKISCTAVFHIKETTVNSYQRLVFQRQLRSRVSRRGFRRHVKLFQVLFKVDLYIIDLLFAIKKIIKVPLFPDDPFFYFGFFPAFGNTRYGILVILRKRGRNEKENTS